MSHLPRYDPDDIATRSDFDSIRADIADLRSELKGDISGLRSELKGDLSDLRSELKADISGLRSELKGDISESRSKITTLRSELRTHGELLFSLQRTLIAGFITFGAALVGLFVAVL
ncbi:MAG: hypothetical protein ACLFRT_11470 [Actinomycetota bacterium]